jgi:hypothetical protein
MPALPPPVADLLSRLDARLVEAWVAGVSVPTRRTRAWLRGKRLAFVDPDQPVPPSLAELDHTARVVIERYANSAALLSGMAGLGGWASIPPEVAASLVGSLRLGQRLCVVFGFDPETDRGQMALWRALASGYQVELPPSGPVGLKASDVPALLLTRPHNVGGALARSVVKGSAFRLLRFTRLVPVLASATGAASGRANQAAIGARMHATLRRLAELPPTDPSYLHVIEEAVEVTG